MSTESNNGGPAFPLSTIDGYATDGMTLRDWFAGQAMPIALKNVPFEHPRDSWEGGRLSRSAPAYKEQIARWRDELAREAYQLADAMIAERDK